MKKEKIILFAIFALVLASRLFFVFQTPYLSSDTAYYNVRHIEHISENFKPIIFDDMSYGGRYILDSHLFHYFLAGLGTVLPDVAIYKIIPELLFSLLVFIIYALAKKITESSTASLFAAFMSGFIPILISESLNNLSVYSILFPLMFYHIYCAMSLETHLKRFIVLSFILPILHPFSFLTSIALLFYVILLNAESMTPKKLTTEALTFYILITMLISFIIYKKAFLSSGLLAVWQNIPSALLNSYFQNINVFTLIYNIGFVPLILGIIGILIGLFREKRQPVYFISAVILANFLLLFLKLINFQTGIVVLGILMAIMSALAIEKLIVYINLTKFSKYKVHILVIFLAILAATMLMPSYFNGKAAIASTISQEEIEALEWVKGNTESGSTVLATVEEGNYIATIAQRKNVADSLFILAPDRYSDVLEMFKTESLVKAQQLIDKYNVDYIYLSERGKATKGIDYLRYMDEKCFTKEFENGKVGIYKVVC